MKRHEFSHIRQLGGKKYSLAELNDAVVKDIVGEDDTKEVNLEQEDLEQEIHDLLMEEDDLKMDPRHHVAAIDNNSLLSHSQLPQVEGNKQQYSAHENNEVYQRNTLFIVDTNFIIDHIDVLEELRLISDRYQHLIIIPRTTIHELDGLKNSMNNSISIKAKIGNKWIYKNLANKESNIKVQKLQQIVDRTMDKDDSILDCCLFFKDKLKCFVILMSNDNNLCAKALAEDILTVSFRPDMTSELIALKAYEEHISRGNNDALIPQDIPISSYDDSSMNMKEICRTIFHEITSTVCYIIRSIMFESYDDELMDTNLNELNTLEKCCSLIVQYWVSVFCEFLEIELAIWKQIDSVCLCEPQNQHELNQFVEFWCMVLLQLFKKRNDTEKQQLKMLINQWNQFNIPS